MMFSGCFRREAKYYRIDMRDNADTTIRKGFPMSIRFAIRGDHIQLDQLLKATGLADSGGNAHAAISEGLVRVDGEVDTRKRAKLRPGQRVEFAGEVVELVAE
jgi:ribosome-associated protein